VPVSVLTFDTFRQHTAVNAIAACGWAETVFAFLANRRVVLAGLLPWSARVLAPWLFVFAGYCAAGSSVLP
jgi:hypothetical protein